MKSEYRKKQVHCTISSVWLDLITTEPTNKSNTEERKN